MNQLNILYYREGDSSKPSGPCNKKTNSGIMKPQFAWTKSTNYSNTVTIDNRRIDIFTVWVRSLIHMCNHLCSLQIITTCFLLDE